MAKKIEFHHEFSLLPATGARARELGQALYFTGKRCIKKHLSPRYASSSNCVQCIAEARGRIAINHTKKTFRGSEQNLSLAIAAFEAGSLEYESINPCPSGHYKRFVSSNNCVECNKSARQARAEKLKWARVYKLYGMTKQDVDSMLDKQSHKCAICESSLLASYHIDHCHNTGKVRGMLCSKCNQALGLLQESKSLFEKALAYIEGHRAA